jgi:hypothetical protein
MEKIMIELGGEIKMTDDVDISKYIEDLKKWCKDPIKLLEYENNIRETIKQNKVDDDFLRTSDLISNDLWKRTIDAINCNSETSVSWAIKKLSILYKRSQLGQKIYIPSINVYLEKDNFERVICEEFSRFILNEILELSQPC